MEYMGMSNKDRSALTYMGNLSIKAGNGHALGLLNEPVLFHYNKIQSAQNSLR